MIVLHKTRNIDGKLRVVCCADMAHACLKGTDNEGYSSLVMCTLVAMDGTVVIGCDLPPARYCPWCGGELTPEFGRLTEPPMELGK